MDGEKETRRFKLFFNLSNYPAGVWGKRQLGGGFVKEVILNIKGGDFFVKGSDITFRDFEDLKNRTITKLNI